MVWRNKGHILCRITCRQTDEMKTTQLSQSITWTDKTELGLILILVLMLYRHQGGSTQPCTHEASLSLSEIPKNACLTIFAITESISVIADIPRLCARQPVCLMTSVVKTCQTYVNDPFYHNSTRKTRFD